MANRHGNRFPVIILFLSFVALQTIVFALIAYRLPSDSSTAAVDVAGAGEHLSNSNNNANHLEEFDRRKRASSGTVKASRERQTRKVTNHFTNDAERQKAISKKKQQQHNQPEVINARPYDNARHPTKKRTNNDFSLIASRLTNRTLKPCLSQDKRLDAKCRAGSGADVVLYNPLDIERHWCGKKIGPNSAELIQLEANADCNHSTTRLFDFMPGLPPIAADDGIPPIILELHRHPRAQSKLAKKSRMNQRKCDVPCFVEEGGSYIKIFNVAGTSWEITYSMEGTQYHEKLRIDPDGHKEDKYWATTSFKSEVPLPYFSWKGYDMKSPPVAFENAIKGATFIANNCDSLNNREKIVTELQKYFRVDSLSGCLHNAEPPMGLGMRDKKRVMREYLFHLAFENQNEEDYITEKLWGSMTSGVIPIYYGASNVKEHAPPNSIIPVSDFPDVEALGVYLNKVVNNKTLYNEHQAWRLAPDYPEDFKRKYNFTHIHSECRLCRWAYAKKYGLGWNHETQTVTKTVIPREVCSERGKTGSVVRPFREHWIASLDGGETQKEEITSRAISGGSCDKRGMKEQTFLVGGHTLRRSIVEHDGVIDVVICKGLGAEAAEEGGNENPIVYGIETGIQNMAGECFVRGRHESDSRKRDTPTFLLDPATRSEKLTSLTIQDTSSRVTILTDWDTGMVCPRAGVVEVMIHDGIQRVLAPSKHMLRVIVEDTDSLHHKKDSVVPSYFGKMMTEDFKTPLELFYVEKR